jgi:hypothetical protein
MINISNTHKDNINKSVCCDDSKHKNITNIFSKRKTGIRNSQFLKFINSNSLKNNLLKRASNLVREDIQEKKVIYDKAQKNLFSLNKQNINNDLITNANKLFNIS